jgi:hypothetical protein
MKPNSYYTKQAKRELRLFNQGKISFCNSAENLKALDKLCDERRASINHAKRMIKDLNA